MKIHSQTSVSYKEKSSQEQLPLNQTENLQESASPNLFSSIKQDSQKNRNPYKDTCQSEQKINYNQQQNLIKEKSWKNALKNVQKNSKINNRELTKDEKGTGINPKDPLKRSSFSCGKIKPKQYSQSNYQYKKSYSLRHEQSKRLFSTSNIQKIPALLQFSQFSSSEEPPNQVQWHLLTYYLEEVKYAQKQVQQAKKNLKEKQLKMQEYEKKYFDYLDNQQPQEKVKALKELCQKYTKEVQKAQNRLEKFQKKLEEAKKKINL